MSRTGEPTKGLDMRSNVPNHPQASPQDNGRLLWAMGSAIAIFEVVALAHRDVSRSELVKMGHLTSHQHPK